MKLFFLILSIFCLLYALFVRAAAGFLKRILIPWLGTAMVCFALALLWEKVPAWVDVTVFLCFLAGAGIFAYYGWKLLKVIRDSRKDCPADYLIVLGAQVYGRRPCDSLQKRLDGALNRFALHPKAVIIVSGGKGDDEEYAEAEVMADYLLKHGVDSARILQEARSRNTAENMKFSMELMDRADAPVGIVTNSFHLYRALELAKKVGLKNAFPVYAASGKATFFHHFCREIIAVFTNDVKKTLGLKNGSV